MLADRIEDLLTAHPAPWKVKDMLVDARKEEILVDANDKIIFPEELVEAINGDCYPEVK